MRNFNDLLVARQKNTNSLLCVGLDPVVEKIPQAITSKYSSIEEQLFQFNKAIIDSTQKYTSSFKPNSAFYEAYGTEGISALKKTCEYIQNSFPEIAIIIDAKRGDIGNTNKGYAQFIFEYLKADAITVIPYMGIESLSTYFEYKEKGIIVGCHSSNSGAKEFQELEINGKPLYHIIAEQLVKTHGDNLNTMIFMGATFPEELINIRKIVGDMTLLVPGVGAQGGDIKAFTQAGLNSAKSGLIISSSRGITFASSGDDFAERAGEEAKKLRDEINQYR